jgi:putative acetyltransferase
VIGIGRESPLSDDLAGLMQRHSAAMFVASPPESVHMLDASGLALADVAFFVMREDGVPIGMGALKRIDDRHAEIKSMHVLAEVRGRGLARRMLAHLVAAAGDAGYARVSLETGTQPVFAPARQLYERAGFGYCGPFAGYTADPHSVFMTRLL